MSMTDREFIEYLEEAGLTSGSVQLYVPIDTPASVEEVTFRGFGIESPGDSFVLGWVMNIQAASQARYLKAFCTGTIKYESGPPNRIILRNGDVLGQLVRQDTLPFWFPLPNYIVYENVDVSETESIIMNYLNDHPDIVESINTLLEVPEEDIEGLVHRFMGNDLPNGIPVPAGERIGMAGGDTSDPTRKSLFFYMQESLDNPDNLFLDPAIYHQHWARFFQNLQGHPLEASLKRIFAGPIANGVVRYVHQDGGNTGDFTNHTLPARLPSIGLQVSNPFDTILIVDDGYYNEPAEIDVNIPVNITSLSDFDVIYFESGSHELPVISGNSSHRVVNIHNTMEIVSISNVEIAMGSFEPTVSNESGSNPAQGGGGIVIQHAAKTYIRNCNILHNGTEEAPFACVAEEGFGGGILIFHSEAYIYHNRISENQSSNRGGGISIFGYGWPIIEDNLIDGNRAHGEERPDGGGIAAEIAIPSNFDFPVPDDISQMWIPEELGRARRRMIGLYRNQIVENSAADDGGGIYLTVLSRVRFRGNSIHHNSAAMNGGGVRITFASWVSMNEDHIFENCSNCGQNVETQSGGGGISVRNSDLILRDVRIENNIAYGWAGGGIYFISSEAGQNLAFSYDDALRDVDVYGANRFRLELRGRCTIQNNHSTYITEQSGDHRKGGGIYVLRYQSSGFTALPITLRFEHITEVDFFAQNFLDPSEEGLAFIADLYIDDKVHRNGNPIHLENLEIGWREFEDLFIYSSD